MTEILSNQSERKFLDERVIFAVVTKFNCRKCGREDGGKWYFMDKVGEEGPNGYTWDRVHYASEFGGDGITGFLVYDDHRGWDPIEGKWDHDCKLVGINGIAVYKFGNKKIDFYVGRYPNNFVHNPSDEWLKDLVRGERAKIWCDQKFFNQEVVGYYFSSKEADGHYSKIEHTHEDISGTTSARSHTIYVPFPVPVPQQKGPFPWEPGFWGEPTEPYFDPSGGEQGRWIDPMAPYFDSSGGEQGRWIDPRKPYKPPPNMG